MAASAADVCVVISDGFMIAQLPAATAPTRGATLWHVYDPVSYELIVEFYRQLSTAKVSRAAALQAAQLKLAGDKRYAHPCYWAPFLLINNWL